MEFFLALILFWQLLGFLRKTLAKDRSWGNSFAKDFIFSVGLAGLSGSRETELQATKSSASKLSSRVKQLWLALNPLGDLGIFLFLFVLSTLFSGGTAGSLAFLINPLANLAQSEAPPTWIYWLVENSWIGVLCGLVLGAFFRLILRRTGFSWILSAILLFAGTASLATVYGIFLGDFLLGRAEAFIRYADKEFRLQSSLSLAFGLAMLLCAPYFMNSVMTWLNGEYSVGLRWIQFAVMVGLFIIMELVLLASFFHFYYAKMQKSKAR